MKEHLVYVTDLAPIWVWIQQTFKLSSRMKASEMRDQQIQMMKGWKDQKILGSINWMIMDQSTEGPKDQRTKDQLWESDFGSLWQQKPGM